MASTPAFDEKIASIFAYGEKLEELPPNPSEGFVVADLVHDIPWWSDRYDPENIRQAQSLEDALKRLGNALGNLAREEYGPRERDFRSRDLRADIAEERLARSRVLAVMTRPTNFEEIDAGAEAISGFFERMLAGAEIEIAPFGNGRSSNAHQKCSIDTSRPLFGVFKPEITHRTLRIQYDKPTLMNLIPAEQPLAVPLHRVVSGEGVSFN